ncbi:MAG TPA: DNA polymerase III subunit delta [Flexivirga sp.]|uniref:DNA polymerase III subunit delta n=1 Tax=Flexivirga sp. TaxID=1962927 RepID=UPI002BAF6A5C|nr:DNA polymerase III subunit delta [Flexivirga sp.]HWC21000.1 DNA polymerase III subunit delta [Flexivirga sp.]
MTDVPPLVLITGPEQILAERAATSTIALVRESDPNAELVRIEAASYESGDLQLHTSPSLFGDSKIVLVRDLDEGREELISDLVDVVSAGSPDATLIVAHKGGVRGKKALDALKKNGARIIEAPAIKSDRDKSAFVTNEFRSAGRKVAPDAVRALLEAVGKDLRELASACKQLVDDTDGMVTADVVQRYYGGKVEATGFRVADAAISGNLPEALRLVRHALASGLDPVPIVAVLASQLRQIARVATAGRGPSGALAKQLGMAPWQVDRARRDAKGWDGNRLGSAIQAVAAADFDVKGGGRDPVYALERAIMTIAAARNG